MQCIARQAEERRRGPEEERNGLLEQSKDFHSQLQKASEDHTSQAEFAAQQLTVYKCELEKERAQRERLLKENVRLTSEKNALQQEKLQLVSQFMCFEVQCVYMCVCVYTCMCVCTCVCVCVYMYVCVHTVQDLSCMCV